MHDILLKILEMSIMGSVVILVTFLMRFLLRKSSKKYVMLLWLIVGLRLLVPVSFESAVSVFNLIPHKLTSITAVAEEPAKTTPSTTKAVQNAKAEINPATDAKAPVVKEESATKVESPMAAKPANSAEAVEAADATDAALTADAAHTTDAALTADAAHTAKAESAVDSGESAEALNTMNAIESSEVEAGKSVNWGSVLGITYVVGVVAVTGYCVVSYGLLKRKLKDAKEIEKNVFESDKVYSPFVFGFVTPKIYLPDVLDKNEREYILLHEKTHIKHGDWISKFVGIAIVAVHWFNPLVWIAYSVFEQDIEMLCDEDTVSSMDKDVKKAYMMSIVSYAKKSRGKVYLVVPLSFSKPDFGKKEVTNRVKNMINYRKGTKITAILTTIVVFGVSTACAFNSTSESKAETSATTEETVATEATDATAETEEQYKPLKFEGVPFDEIMELEQGYGSASVTYFYNLLMDKAAELHSEDDDNSLIYGFVDTNMFYSVEYKMFVYDTANGEFTTYSYDSRERSVVSIDYEVFTSYKDMSSPDVKPEEWLMPYDDFVNFAGVVTYDLFAVQGDYVYNKDRYHEAFPDGRYEGSLFALSEDLTTANVGIAPLLDCDYVIENLKDIKEGDVVPFNGVNKKTASASTNEYGTYCIFDPEGDYASISAYPAGDVELIEVSENVEGRHYTLAEVPVADDVVIHIYNKTTDEFLTFTRDTFMDYIRSLDKLVHGMAIFEGTGVSFATGTRFNFYNYPVVIKDGAIVEMTLSLETEEDNDGIHWVDESENGYQYYYVDEFGDEE